MYEAFPYTSTLAEADEDALLAPLDALALDEPDAPPVGIIIVAPPPDALLGVYDGITTGTSAAEADEALL